MTDKIEPERPQFKHDCDECVFLGRYSTPTSQPARDLYVCRKTLDAVGGCTIIGRHGNDGLEYGSYPITIAPRVALDLPYVAEALKRCADMVAGKLTSDNTPARPPAATFTWARLQEEQRPWVEHNFPGRPSWQPLLGIVEEIGELREACARSDFPERDDALADTVIFASDYATAMGFDFATTMRRAEKAAFGSESPDRRRSHEDFAVSLGKLAHAHLKLAQGIRGEPVDLLGKTEAALTEVMTVLFAFASCRGVRLTEVVEKTWAKVKLRDWKRWPTTGRPPADSIAEMEAD